MRISDWSSDVCSSDLGRDGRRHMLRTGIAVQAGELIDAAVMDASALSRFVGEQTDDARAQGVLFSLHLKATMMKVSDPIMRSEEHTSELQSLMRSSYAVLCLNKKKPTHYDSNV